MASLRPLTISSLSSFFSPSVFSRSAALRLEEAVEALLEVADARRGHVVEVAVRDDPQDRDLLLDWQRLELRLLQHLGRLLAARQLVARGLVQVARELGESGQLAVLRQVQLQRPGDLAHGLGLRRPIQRGTPRCRRSARDAGRR